jgi:hypothetical protein
MSGAHELPRAANARMHDVVGKWRSLRCSLKVRGIAFCYFLLHHGVNKYAIHPKDVDRVDVGVGPRAYRFVCRAQRGKEGTP